MTPLEKNIAVAAALGILAAMLISIAAMVGDFAMPAFLFPLVLLGAPLCASGMVFVAERYAGRFPFAPSFAKFLTVGSVSTFLELAVLNVLFAATGITAGIFFSFFKAFTYVLGMTNSYIFNKYWSFGSRGGNMVMEAGKFIAVNILGLLINVATASFIVNVIGAPAGISGALWANIGAIIAVFVVLVWNFLNYKFFVFRHPSKNGLSKAR